MRSRPDLLSIDASRATDHPGAIVESVAVSRG